MLEQCFPGAQWAMLPDLAGLGWLPGRLRTIGDDLAAGGSTALMVVDRGHLVLEWGDTARKSSIASVRKSLIGLLYGIAVAHGQVKLDATLAELEIDDVGGLGDREKQATVQHLLMARSGVFHPSVYDTAQGRPERGAHPPGSYWFYNNWDFNVLGGILENRLGETVFETLARWLAGPILMQDFTLADGRYEYGPESRFPVYKLNMSARDLARIGLLVLREGRWAGNQVVPRSWIGESTRPHSYLGGGRGYGYLWWTAAARAIGDSMSCNVPIVYASGFGGQYIVLLPGLDLVVVHRAAHVDAGISHARMGEILRRNLEARSPGVFH